MPLILCQDPQYAFIHIPKSGGISIGAALDHAAQARKFPLIGHTLPTHADYNDVVSTQGEAWTRSACVFGIIRNPWSRVFSYWNFRRETTAGRIHQRKLGQTVKPGTTDENDRLFLQETDRLGFNDWIMRQDDETDSDQVFTQKPQVAWLTDQDGVLKADRVLQLENLDMDFLFGLGAHTLPHLNKSNNATSYVDAFSQPCRDFVQKHFAADIELGKYRFGE